MLHLTNSSQDYLRKAAFPDHYPPSKNPMANIHMGKPLYTPVIAVVFFYLHLP